MVLYSIVQSISTLIAGSVLGLVFIWKVALVGVGKLVSHNFLTEIKDFVI